MQFIFKQSFTTPDARCDVTMTMLVAFVRDFLLFTVFSVCVSVIMHSI